MNTPIPILMMMLVQDTVSMVRPQKCMNPPTLTRVRTTQPSTFHKYYAIYGTLGHYTTYL